MDPLSALFSAYLNSITGVTIEHTKEVLGTDVKAEVMEYQGQKISFQYQMWKIKDKSVCADHKDNIAVFSKCTLAAQKLFTDACRYFNENKGAGWKYDKYKNMYCSASISYKPIIASISPATEETELEVTRKECNTAIAATAGSNNADDLRQKNVACNKYQALLNKK